MTGLNLYLCAMNYADRQRVVHFLISLEQRYPVSMWQVRGIDIWPVWKMKLFAEAFRASNDPGLEREVSQKPGKWARWALYVRAYLDKWGARLPVADKLFVAEPVFRVWWEGESRNRFFDVLMDRADAQGQSTLLAETKPLREQKQIYRDRRVIDISTLHLAFLHPVSVEQDWAQLRTGASFKNFLTDIEVFFGWNENRLKRATATSVRLIEAWRDLFKWLLARVRPTYVFQLCYYNSAQYGLNLACRERGIQVSELQHGSQGHSHPAYFFRVQPLGGYNILPHTFLCWDSSSHADLVAWCEPGHQAVVFGNPWIDLLSAYPMPEGYSSPIKPLVAYTLQPLAEPLPVFLLDAVVHTVNDVQWWFRFHPRMSAADVTKLKTLFDRYGLGNRVRLEEPEQAMPLPLLLRQAALHISRYSGSIAEAALVGTQSLLIDPIGATTFSRLIEEGKAFLALTSEDVVGKIRALVNPTTTIRAHEETRTQV